jgi:poly-gamma-glutamate capsule biosynthesis protein CapA/YwtB (metallophosphatase superfamily)
MSDVFIGFVGDVLIDRDDPDEVFCEVRDLLSTPDILFANLESPYSDTPGMAITAPLVIVPRAHNLEAYARAGFHVLSLANNHIVDAGHEALLDTRARLQKAGVATVGAGENLMAARRPQVLERGTQRMGFLAYASVFPHGYEARASVPGLAPLRAYNHFHELPEYFAPGYLPRIETIPDPEDHRNLIRDLDALRKDVDVVIASFHWGDHLRPFVLTDHERRTARLAIDHGADLVLGHHHHALRGIEWYRGRPIFYGLGHFVFDLRLVLTDELKNFIGEIDPQSYAVAPREGWPLLPLHPDTRMSMFGWVRAEQGRIVEVGFVPCRLRPNGQVVAVDPDSAEGQEVVSYIAQCNRSQKLNGIVEKGAAPMFRGHRCVRIVPIRD